MIRIATVGTSWISAHFAKAVKETPGIELAGVYSRDLGRAREFQLQVGAPAGWSNLNEVLADSTVDAVYVASPNALHLEQALAAIRAGKHVVLEKPATTSASDFMKLLDEAKKRDVVVFEAMRSAYDPGTQKIRELIPTIGQIRLAAFNFCQRSSRYDMVLAGQPVNIFDPGLGGGALLDLGVYCVSMMIDLLGVPSRVTGAAVGLPTGADGAGAAVASYPEFVSTLTYSKITASTEANQIQGELGTLSFDSVAAPRIIEVRYLNGEIARFELPYPADNMAYEAARFVDLVAGEDPGPDNRRTLESLRAIDEIRASISGLESPAAPSKKLP